MTAYVTHTRRASHHRPRRGFSLAEMLIALLILAFGLLVIGASLPIGLRYTEQSTARIAASNAANLAQDVLAAQVRDPRTGARVRLNATPQFDPADPVDMATFEAYFTTLYRPPGQPLLRAMPLVMENVLFRADGEIERLRDWRPVALVSSWLVEMDGFIDLTNTTCSLPLDVCGTQWDLFDVGTPTGLPIEFDLDRLMPALSFSQRVFPPVSRMRPFDPPGADPNRYGYTVEEFFDEPYERDFVDPTELDDFPEFREALERTVSWTALYRPLYFNGPNPERIEVTTIVTERPTPEHGFPVQDEDPGVAADVLLQEPRALIDPNGPPDTLMRTAAPTPWLVAFTAINPDSADLTLSPTITFECTPEVGRLLPPGSVFFPASGAAERLVQGVGFVLHGGGGTYALDDLRVEWRAINESGNVETKSLSDNFNDPDGTPLIEHDPHDQADDEQWATSTSNLRITNDRIEYTGAQAAAAYLPLTFFAVNRDDIVLEFDEVEIPVDGRMEIGLLDRQPAPAAQMFQSHGISRVVVRDVGGADLVVSLFDGRHCAITETVSKPSGPFSLSVEADREDGCVQVRIDGSTEIQRASVAHVRPIVRTISGYDPNSNAPIDMPIDSLPVYTVLERVEDDPVTIIVRNDGYWPEVDANGLSLSERDRALAYPVWVIPPPFAETLGDEPLYESVSPVLLYRQRVIDVGL